jgi:hypothetical protein
MLGDRMIVSKVVEEKRHRDGGGPRVDRMSRAHAEVTPQSAAAGSTIHNSITPT